MKAKKFHVYYADLNPRLGREAGKICPVVVVQTDLLNLLHPSTMVCPITTQVNPRSDLLRVHLRKGEAGLPKASDVLVDQIRAIDNRRFVEEVGEMYDRNKVKLLHNLKLLILE